MLDPKYLGDGVYIEDEGYSIKLYTSNGITQTNVIILEPDVLSSLESYLLELKTENGKS